MSERPSDGWEIDELRDEFDWMYEFGARMAERIRQDPDVHNLADYVGKLERENAELRELVQSMHYDLAHQTFPPDWIGEYEEDMRNLGIEVEP